MSAISALLDQVEAFVEGKLSALVDRLQKLEAAVAALEQSADAPVPAPKANPARTTYDKPVRTARAQAGTASAKGAAGNE